MTNPWKRLQKLLPQDPLLIGDVVLHHNDGTSTVTLADGRELRVRGQNVAVGQKAFIRGGEIRGPAPNLAVVSITL